VDLSTHEATVGRHPVLSVQGEIDLATLPILHNALGRFVGAHPATRLVVDLDGVYACDDTALGSLLGAAGRARDSGGDLVVVCHEGALRTRLARTGFDRAVPVVEAIGAVDNAG